MLVRICVQRICIIFLLWHKCSTPFQHQHNWCQPPFTVTRCPSRSNGSTPVPDARPQPPICQHCPVPSGLTRPIKPTKPAPTSHFITNTPSAMSQSFIFHQITCPSNPFSNRHAKRSEIVPSFLNRLPAPPSHFWTNMPSTVRPSRIFH